MNGDGFVSCQIAPRDTTERLGFDKKVIYVNEGEEIFVLRSQDLTAAPLVSLWADAQRYLAAGLNAGVDLSVLCLAIEGRLKQVFLDVPADGQWSDKVESAYVIAEKMAAFKPQKVAD